MIDLPKPFHPTRREEITKDGDVVYKVIYIRPPQFFNLPEVSVRLTIDQYRRYEKWRDGHGLIQVLLPDLSDSEREMLMTGLGDADFDRFAGSEE
jgi:hypothetical protein